MAFRTEHPTNAERRAVHDLAGRKLTASRFSQAKSFIFDRRRSHADLEALVKRLEPLPDLVVDVAARTNVSGLSAGELAQMQAERDAGATLRQIADKHQVSYATVSRRTRPAPTEKETT